MAVINDQELTRSRASAARIGSTIRVTARGPLHPRLRHAADNSHVRAVATGPAALPGVTRLRARPAAVEPEQLPLAVGFGSTGGVAPGRLWVVPGMPGDLVTLPADPDDGCLDGGCLDDGCLDGGWSDADWSPSTGRGVDAEPERGSRAGRFAIGLGVHDGRARRQGPTVLSEPAPLHLTARGRAVLLLLAAAIGAAVVVFAWFGAGSSATAVPAVQPARVTVHDGDTLWSIAGKVAPNRDPRAEVAKLLQLNHLSTPALIPGQVLLTR